MEQEVYSQIKNAIKKLFNIDLNHYKDEQMKRRLDSWLARSRMQTWTEYLNLVAENQVERERFRDYLTINVTEFFRDPERWKALRTDVMPVLLKELDRMPDGRKGLRVWSAGCSIGVEAYTLAILLDEEAPNRPHYLLATDFDRGALQKATARGPYTAEEIRNLTPEQRNKYLTPENNRFLIKESLGKRVTFREQNMLNDRFENGFDLIVCRNVVIYFTNEAKAVLYQKFQAALRPGGVLFMGGTEIIPRPADIGLRNHGISLYLKV
jgi:chemotaxis protein methyltransferase CheR